MEDNDPTADAGQRATMAQGGGIDAALVGALVDEIGRPKTADFVNRALAEAAEVLRLAANWSQDGAGLERAESAGELAQRIHAAIGPAGLTGLTGVAQALRALLFAVGDGTGGGRDGRARAERILLAMAVAAARDVLPGWLTTAPLAPAGVAVGFADDHRGEIRG